MSYQEKTTWVYALITLFVPGVYLVSLWGRIQETPVTQIDYQGPMLQTIFIAIGLTIVATILIAIAAPKEAEQSDERDKSIYRFGEYIATYPFYTGVVIAMFLAFAEFPHFWIANAIYASFVVAALTSSCAKLLAYHRGI